MTACDVENVAAAAAATAAAAAAAAAQWWLEIVPNTMTFRVMWCGAGPRRHECVLTGRF